MVKSEARRLLVSYEAANAGTPTSAVGRDAALGGLFIETKDPLAVGALLSVELTSPGVSVTLEARVFSVREKSEGPDRPAGMAVRFLDLPAGMLGKLQSILDHHRPPARTRLGVGDEKDMLWASAGGQEEEAPPEEAEESAALELAASLVVEGRPTPEVPPPRHPTPRMVPLTPRSQEAARPKMPAPWPPTPSTAPPPAPASSSYLPPAEREIIAERRMNPALIGIILVATIGVLIGLALALGAGK